MKRIEKTEPNGRKYAVAVNENGAAGEVLLGPPDVVSLLKLPEPLATKLHNELYRRGLFMYDDVRRRPKEVQAAIQAALKFDAAVIVDAYHNLERDSLSLEEV